MSADPPRLDRVLRGFALVTIVFLALEIAARTILTYGNDDDRFVRYASLAQIHRHPERTAHFFARRYTPHRYLGYYPTPNFSHPPLTHNARGYKDAAIPVPKPAGEFRIVVAGGSTTYTTTIADTRNTFPKQLESALRDRGRTQVRVINAGVEGWTSYEILIDLALRTLDLEPDMVVLHLGVNDAYARIVWPPEAFTADNAGYRPAPSHERFAVPWYENATLIRGLLIKAGLTKPHFDRIRPVLETSPAFLAEEWAEQRANDAYPSGVFVDVPLARILETNTDALFLRNVAQCIELIEARNAAPVLVTVPFHDATADDGFHHLWSSEPFIAAVNATYERLAELAERHDIPFYDCAGDFPDDASLFADGLHLKPDGVATKAGRVAAFLAPQIVRATAPPPE